MIVMIGASAYTQSSLFLTGTWKLHKNLYLDIDQQVKLYIEIRICRKFFDNRVSTYHQTSSRLLLKAQFRQKEYFNMKYQRSNKIFNENELVMLSTDDLSVKHHTNQWREMVVRNAFFVISNHSRLLTS